MTDSYCDGNNNNFGYFTISAFTEAGQEDMKIQIPFVEVDTGSVGAKVQIFFFKQEPVSSTHPLGTLPFLKDFATFFFPRGNYGTFITFG